MRWPNRFRETCREPSQRALFGAGSFAERHARDEMEIGDGWILLDTGDQFFPIDVGKRDIHDGEMKGIVAKRGRSKEFYGHEAGVRLGHDGSPAG